MARRTLEQKRTLQALLGKQERARDTRRKILLGALVLQRMTNSANEADVAWLKSWMSRELPNFLTRDTDRLLLADLFSPALSPDPTNEISPVRTAIAADGRVLASA